MANTIQHKRSSTTTAVPSTLAAAEFAVNTTDQRVFIGYGGSDIQEIRTWKVPKTCTLTTLPSANDGDTILVTDTASTLGLCIYKSGWKDLATGVAPV